MRRCSGSSCCPATRSSTLSQVGLVSSLGGDRWYVKERGLPELGDDDERKKIRGSLRRCEPERWFISTSEIIPLRQLGF